MKAAHIGTGDDVFDVTFDGVDDLAEKLQQPCRQLGLTCGLEDDADGKAAVMRRVPGRTVLPQNLPVLDAEEDWESE